MQQLCNNKGMGVIISMAVIGLIIVMSFASTVNECDAPVCFIDSNEPANWIITYIFLLIGSIILSWCYEKFVSNNEFDGFNMFFVCFAIILCFIFPIMNGNIGECDAPLCYLGGPQHDDSRIVHDNNFYNWGAFYLVLSFQILFGSFALSCLLQVVKKDMKYGTLIFASALFVSFCVMPLLLNNNIGECEAFICYLGAPSPASNINHLISEVSVTDNTNNNLYVFYGMSALQTLLVIFLIVTICDLYEKKNCIHKKTS